MENPELKKQLSVLKREASNLGTSLDRLLKAVEAVEREVNEAEVKRYCGERNQALAEIDAEPARKNEPQNAEHEWRMLL